VKSENYFYDKSAENIP